MTKTLLSRTALLGVALLLSTAALGVTLAAARDHRDRHGDATAAVMAPGEGHRWMASEHGMRRHHDEGQRRRHAEDDADGEGDEGGRGGVGQPRPSGPNVPAPDNGLFNGKTKPKVDVQ